MDIAVAGVLLLAGIVFIPALSRAAWVCLSLAWAFLLFYMRLRSLT